MSFEKTPPIWNNAGQEPSLELQENGFTAGYKPPAPYFNYLFHQNTECLKELQEKVAEKENVNAEFAKRNITTYTLLHQIGITIGTETIQSLAQKIPMNSILTYSVSANYKDDTYPDYGEQDRNGVMEVIRGASTNVFFRFTRSANADKDSRMWVGNWGTTTGWSGWKEVAYVTNGTLTSDNADFAEVGEWSDGNPDSEDRLGYFVSVSKTESGITMTKATADSDVRGVTIASPAFATNASRDKYGEDGNLLNQYNYVAFAGFATVIDNGTCTVNGRCMPDGNGCAVPSTNTMGYQVIERVDDTHILILVEPNADMLNRIKDDIEALEVNKADSDHTHKYAGSSSVGGAATSANKLNTNAGSATNPIYFSDGVPKACTYELKKTVPEDAKFTDTTYTNATTEKDGLMSASDKVHVNKIGDTDISGIGDGTVTGAISEINSKSNYNANSNIFKMENPKYTGTEAYPNYGAKNYTITDDVFAGVQYGGYAWDLETNVGEIYTISLTNALNKKIFADETITSEEGISSLTFTAKTTTTKIGVLYGYNGNNQSNTKIQVNVGSDIKQYEKYSGKSNLQLSNDISAIELETAELKMLGWTVPKEMPLRNAISGDKFIQNVGRIDLGNLNYTLHPVYGCFYQTIKDGKSTKSQNGSTNAYCSKYTLYNGSFKTQADKTLGTGYAFKTGSSCEVLIKDSSYTDTTSFKNAMKGVYLYYELDTPVEMQIDGNEITTLDTISDKWDSTKTYYTGDYCIYNNQLWKCKGMNTGAEPSGSSGSIYWDKVTIASELNSKANTGYETLLTIPVGDIDYQASTTYTLSKGKFSNYSSILLVDKNNSYTTIPLPIFIKGSKVQVGTGDVEVKYSSDIKIVVSISGESAGNYGLTVYGL